MKMKLKQIISILCLYIILLGISDKLTHRALSYEKETKKVLPGQNEHGKGRGKAFISNKWVIKYLYAILDEGKVKLMLKRLHILLKLRIK